MSCGVHRFLIPLISSFALLCLNHLPAQSTRSVPSIELPPNLTIEDSTGRLLARLDDEVLTLYAEEKSLTAFGQYSHPYAIAKLEFAAGDTTISLAGGKVPLEGRHFSYRQYERQNGREGISFGMAELEVEVEVSSNDYRFIDYLFGEANSSEHSASLEELIPLRDLELESHIGLSLVCGGRVARPAVGVRKGGMLIAVIEFGSWPKVELFDVHGHKRFQVQYSGTKAGVSFFDTPGLTVHSRDFPKSRTYDLVNIDGTSNDSTISLTKAGAMYRGIRLDQYDDIGAMGTAVKSPIRLLSGDKEIWHSSY